MPSIDLARWIEGNRHSVNGLLRVVDPIDLCVEMLDYPYDLIEGIVSDFRLSICMDIGHLILHGYDPDDYLDRYLPRTRVIHLHGVEDGHDHLSLASLPTGLLNNLVTRLGSGENPYRVLTIELFDKGMLNQSFNCLSPFV